MRKMSALGAYVSEEMKRRNLNQLELAERSKVPNSTLSRIINTDVRPDPVNVTKLAIFFEEPPEKLMVLAGYPMGDPSTPEATEQELLSQIRSLPWLGDLARDIAALPPDQQRIVVRVVRAMLDDDEQSDLGR